MNRLAKGYVVYQREDDDESSGYDAYHLYSAPSFGRKRIRHGNPVKRSSADTSGKDKDQRSGRSLNSVLPSENAQKLRQRKLSRRRKTETGDAAVRPFVKQGTAEIAGRLRDMEALSRLFTGAAGAVPVIFTVIICISALLAASPFRIFLYDDSGIRPLERAVRDTETEFLEEIGSVRDSSSCSVYEIRGHQADWEDVLSVYAVMASLDSDGRSGLTEMDENREQLLRKIHADMNRIEWTQVQDPEDPDIGRLVINVTALSADEAAEMYGFSADEKQLLDEVMSFGEGFWESLTGGFSTGMGIVPTAVSRKSLGMFSWPLPSDGSITSGFGYRSDPFTGNDSFHGGTDIAAESGTPILAAADGIVTVSNGSDSWGGGYGYHVMIEHEGGYMTVYGHCSFVCVTEGQQARKGEMIAGVGTTGNSTGDHLHFEIRENGVKTDPMQWFGT